jgi:hypothetical protein
VTEQTYYRWRKEFNGFRPHPALNYQTPAAETSLKGGPNTGGWTLEMKEKL